MSTSKMHLRNFYELIVTNMILLEIECSQWKITPYNMRNNGIRMLVNNISKVSYPTQISCSSKKAFNDGDMMVFTLYMENGSWEWQTALNLYNYQPPTPESSYAHIC